VSEESGSAQYEFEIGQVIHHKRYHYRGVIFGRDQTCQGDEAWYQKNQTQPDRDQPWYHVMVDGAEHTTYVAQSNLEPDETGEPVNHPLLGQFFKSLHQGRYYAENLN